MVKYVYYFRAYERYVQYCKINLVRSYGCHFLNKPGVNRNL
jgi:hypothetical protein